MSGGVSVQAQFMDWLDAESGGAGDVSKYYGSAFTRDDELAEHGVPRRGSSWHGTLRRGTSWQG